ncbi:MAG: FecR domain-containing protein [Winogradskyella sp.]|uniref:FecR family protein n=1 Tax=Winogradskyella sp. TaxID=1883156 RepID=UPI0017AAA064|nr:FecR domain-containing protein [Winogradskyella sp.]
MEKEILIQKWLSNELSSSELDLFKKLPEAASYQRITDAAKLFKDESYDVSTEYNKLNAIIEQKRMTTNNQSNSGDAIPLFAKFKPYMQIAAVLVLGLAIYYGPFYDNMKTIKTAENQKTVTLPDASLVALNNSSQIRYKKSDFKNKRIVNLVGEAEFDVKEGSVFEVVTWTGVISDLQGTKFNVKQRANSFEIIAKEGEVTFTYKGKVVRLPAGKKLNIIDGKIIESKPKLA